MVFSTTTSSTKIYRWNNRALAGPRKAIDRPDHSWGSQDWFSQTCWIISDPIWWKKTSYEALGMYLESSCIGNILREMSVSLKGHVGWIMVWWLCDLFCPMVPNLILFQLGGWSTVRLTVCWRFRSYSVLRLWEKISLRRLERRVKRWSSQAWNFMPWVMLWLLWEDTDSIRLVLVCNYNIWYRFGIGSR